MQRSGVTPSAFCAPPDDQRKPVMTSSISITTPRLAVTSRIACTKPGGSGTWPHDAPDGSNITTAMSSRLSISFTTAPTSSVGIRIERSVMLCATPGGEEPS